MNKLLFLSHLFCAALVMAEGESNATRTDMAAPHLCDRLIEIKKSPFFDRLSYPQETGRFYNRRCEVSKPPAWFDETSSPTPDAIELLRAIETSESEGLNPERYRRSEAAEGLRQLREGTFPTPQEKADLLYRLDMLLTDAYIALAKDLYEGMTKWEDLRALKEGRGEKFEWDPPQKEPLSYPEYLSDSLQLHRIGRSLSTLSPDYDEYRRLRNALALYRQIEAQGDTRTSRTGKNVPDAIRLNLDRFRWLPRGMEKNGGYLDVNIPSFTLKVLDHGYEMIQMKTIVGRRERPTPVLAGKLSHALLNPTWTAPETIIRNDILGGKGEISEYLQSHGMRVYEHVNGEMAEIDPTEIDWSRYVGKKQIPYTFKADAGEANPLGKIKFMFPNRHTVYLHDTNSPGLFKKRSRTFSSGCVRISEPQKLLDYLLGNGESPAEEAPRYTEEPDTKINLKKKLPILFRYMTVSADPESRITMYDDIYGYDELQMALMRKSDLIR